MCVLWNLLIRLELDKFILLLTLLFKIILLLLPYLTSVCKATTLLLFAGILKAFKTSCNISCTATAQKGKFDAYKEALEHAMKEQSSHWTDKIKPLCQHTNSGCLYIWDRWDLPLARLWPRAGLSPRGRHLWRAPGHSEAGADLLLKMCWGHKPNLRSRGAFQGSQPLAVCSECPIDSSQESFCLA